MDNYALVPRQEEEEVGGGKKHDKGKSSTSGGAKIVGAPPPAHGFPVGHGRVQRNEWESGVFGCLGKNDEFYSSDLEVCALGCCAPCVLHGSNVERLGSNPSPSSNSSTTTFATHCLPYAGLFLVGNCFFGWNCLAPWFSYPNRTAIRRRFNLQGSCEDMAESIGCSGNIRMNEAQYEHCESACDLATHISCHACALCQEARELRRRLPHPGFAARPVIVMLPPGGQTMGR